MCRCPVRFREWTHSLHTVPVPQRFRQAFLTIRDRELQRVVTVIELLSPGNKTAGEGRTEYLVRRSNVFCTPAHLVEIDWLRGGERLPTREPLRPANSYVFTRRVDGQEMTLEPGQLYKL